MHGVTHGPVVRSRPRRMPLALTMLVTARGSSERSSEWVRALPDVVAVLNDEVTRLTGKKPSEAIKA